MANVSKRTHDKMEAMAETAGREPPAPRVYSTQANRYKHALLGERLDLLDAFDDARAKQVDDGDCPLEIARADVLDAILLRVRPTSTKYDEHVQAGGLVPAVGSIASQSRGSCPSRARTAPGGRLGRRRDPPLSSCGTRARMACGTCMCRVAWRVR